MAFLQQTIVSSTEKDTVPGFLDEAGEGSDHADYFDKILAEKSAFPDFDELLIDEGSHVPLLEAANDEDEIIEQTFAVAEEESHVAQRYEPLHATVLHDDQPGEELGHLPEAAEVSETESESEAPQSWWRENHQAVKRPYGMNFWAERWEGLSQPYKDLSAEMAAYFTKVALDLGHPNTSRLSGTLGEAEIEPCREDRRKNLFMGMAVLGMERLEPDSTAPTESVVDIDTLARETPIHATTGYTGTDFMDDMNQKFGTHFRPDDWTSLARHLSPDTTYRQIGGDDTAPRRWNHQGLVSTFDKVQALRTARELGRA